MTTTDHLWQQHDLAYCCVCDKSFGEKMRYERCKYLFTGKYMCEDCADECHTCGCYYKECATCDCGEKICQDCDECRCKKDIVFDCPGCDNYIIRNSAEHMGAAILECDDPECLENYWQELWGEYICGECVDSVC
jgi:hypothetical protein